MDTYQCPSMDEMKGTNISIEPQYEVKPELSVSRFVKVFMQGELVGRKINMATHNSYASLSFTLKRLGNNFSSKLKLPIRSHIPYISQSTEKFLILYTCMYTIIFKIKHIML